MNQSHCCSKCKKNNVKLYRIYGNFLRDSEIYCKKHAPKGITLVPLMEDLDGSVWGYTSVPDDAIARWNSLPN